MKTAFVTGGSRGIGKSIALDLGKKFHVVVGYSVSNEKAKEVSHRINSQKSKKEREEVLGLAREAAKKAGVQAAIAAGWEQGWKEGIQERDSKNSD